jgi:hypothetical protein
VRPNGKPDRVWCNRPRYDGRRRNRRVETFERLVEAAFAGERPSQPRQVTRRRSTPRIRIGIAPFHMTDEVRQRAHILVVVAHDLDERVGGSAAQEVEVPPRDLPALHVTDPVEPEQLGFRRAKARVRHPVPEQPADEREQVEVAGMLRRRPACHAVARDEQRPVEAAAVVGHKPGVRGDPLRDEREQGRLLRVVGQEQLDLPETIALPPAQPDQERNGPGRRREARRLRVEADERRVRRRLAGETAEPLAVNL